MPPVDSPGPGNRSPGQLRRIRSSSSWGSLQHMGGDEKVATTGTLGRFIAPFLNLWRVPSASGRMAGLQGSAWLVHGALVFVQVSWRRRRVENFVMRPKGPTKISAAGIAQCVKVECLRAQMQRMLKQASMYPVLWVVGVSRASFSRDAVIKVWKGS
jgi:hypothetical protein